MSTNYAVIVEKFAERHFISKFKKKYKGAWDVTFRAIQEELKRIDTLIGETNIAETITDQENIKICKTEFRVHGTQESRHTSGNRCIVAVDKDTCVVKVLLVYAKTDLTGNRETEQWKNLIKENYLEYSKIL
ncbi:hypothetical protein A3G06_00240 [Candidatus Nomurabacteria bacterium RIFCSPLOWO2_12_FULL_46_14]|uniref:Addiction module toxin RelE n=1 Tax=Candidatus Nomurabacteria bacterium RIFCSPLOWO2_12_FULL_46_14 TaxID=1801797 RepID=A0A1F6Y8Z8_9BACT|nr:MAG: hypothetical protein A2739_02325 [Candidatus Giovannonibacteria bacterium RIFCSPHIGHO2_01_FULL_43_100]OGJ02806.1 MAG: hypothetical protein A3G06_00240 [Candidatus Nomurabacteria bacterium RIFCSPLOWO2_12_FULL_46_14]